jgi:hypothetical protein
MNKQLGYLIESFDFHIVAGESPHDAWDAALKDYVYVFHSTNDKTPPNRAAKVMADHLKAWLEKEGIEV